MLKGQYINSFAFRHALSVGFAVFVACIANIYYSFSHEYWIVLTTLLVCKSTRGTPLRQGHIILDVIIAAILGSSLLLLNFHSYSLIYILVSCVFIFSAYLVFINRPQSNKIYFITLLFSIVFMIAVLPPAQTEDFLQNRMIDVVIGAIIGLWCVIKVLPVRLDNEFSEGVIPILKSLNSYSHELTKGFLDSVRDKTALEEKKLQVEISLQIQQGMYPEWVYEVGFNRGLRSGFRFFLINIERVTELLFSMGFLISRGIDPVLLNELDAPIINAMKKNQELLSVLFEYFTNHTLITHESDYTHDIVDLEKALQRAIPGNIEILDISPSYLLLTALVRDIRDLRGLLLQLVMALPVDQTGPSVKVHKEVQSK